MADNLVVVSKVKKYVKETSGMSTSANAMTKLSEIIQKECDRAIENAKNDRRKTVMDRDFSE